MDARRMIGGAKGGGWLWNNKFRLASACSTPRFSLSGEYSSGRVVEW